MIWGYCEQRVESRDIKKGKKVMKMSKILVLGIIGGGLGLSGN